jgi:hypothetical protein
LRSAENAVGCGIVMIALNASGGAVGVVAIGDAADRMAEDFDRRLGDVLVVVRRTRLAEDRILFTDGTGPRFAETRLSDAPDPRRLAA